MLEVTFKFKVLFKVDIKHTYNACSHVFSVHPKTHNLLKNIMDKDYKEIVLKGLILYYLLCTLIVFKENVYIRLFRNR